MTSARARGSRPAVFVQQLHRAAAQRGKLDPVYQELSDHWTAILQRLYPVWALIGPGLSDPGHIEIHSRTIYLDSETLLGPREQIASGGLKQRAILRCFGVGIHETLHAKHTKRWAIEHELALGWDANTVTHRGRSSRRRPGRLRDGPHHVVDSLTVAELGRESRLEPDQVAQAERGPALDERRELAIAQRYRIELGVTLASDRRRNDVPGLAMVLGQL